MPILCVIHKAATVADVEGAELAPPPPLGDGLTPSLTVLLKCDNSTVVWRHHRQFHFKHVKHGTRIFQMIAASGFLTALECIKFVFDRGSALNPTFGA